MKQLPQNHIELAGRVTIGPRGQVVIPADVREKLGLKTGDHMLALFIPDSDAVAFVHESKLQALIDQAGGSITGALKGSSDNKNTP